jgi:hypothetical protein
MIQNWMKNWLKSWMKNWTREKSHVISKMPAVSEAEAGHTAY